MMPINQALTSSQQWTGLQGRIFVTGCSMDSKSLAAEGNYPSSFYSYTEIDQASVFLNAGNGGSLMSLRVHNT